MYYSSGQGIILTQNRPMLQNNIALGELTPSQFQLGGGGGLVAANVSQLI